MNPEPMKSELMKPELLILGVHQSIAGGLDQALYQAHKMRCRAVQFFCSNQRQWKHLPLTAAQVDAFNKAKEITRLTPLIVHGSYLINPAAVDVNTLEKSICAMIDEYRQCDILGVDCLVIHPGSHMGLGEAEGLRKISQAINQVLGKVQSSVKLLLETTSGQGTSLGCTFEQLAAIIEGVEDSSRIGVCLDTCHVFAAGYDIREANAYQNTMKTFDKVIGIKRLRVIHVNDSKTGLASHVDRHEHIGKGRLGRQAFRNFLTDKRLRHIPFILETPKGRSPGGKDYDMLNLAALRRCWPHGRSTRGRMEI